MTFPLLSLRKWPVIFILLAASATAYSDTERKFTTSPTLSTEAQILVQLLETDHYNRNAVVSGDYNQVIPEYMKALDQQHLFFLDSDRDEFVKRFGNNAYYTVSYLG